MKSKIDKTNFKLIVLPEATREQMQGTDKQYIKSDFAKRVENYNHKRTLQNEGWRI